jgi:hypothetical protein
MTAATPPTRPSGSAATDLETEPAVLRGAPWLVAARIGLWVGLQLVLVALRLWQAAVADHGGQMDIQRRLGSCCGTEPRRMTTRCNGLEGDEFAGQPRSTLRAV